MEKEQKETIEKLNHISEKLEVTPELICQLADESAASIYVADYDTDELLYINKPGKNVLKVKGEVEKGQKCYKYLMRRDTPCSFCHKSLMTEDAFRENTITFPFNGNQYRIRSKIIYWGGRKVHVHYITDETNLLNQQKELRTLTDDIPGGIGIYYVYSDGRIEPSYLNDGYYEMIGSAREARARYHGFAVLEAIEPEDAKRLQKEVMASVRENRQVNAEIRVRRDDGSYLWLAIRAEVVKRTPKRNTLYCVYSDIDQLKKTQEALEESSRLLNAAYQKTKASEEKFKSMMEHIPGAMVIFEVRERMLWLRYISESCKSITGFTAREVYERGKDDPLADAHPDFREAFLQHEWQDIQKGGKITYKYKAICKDGNYKWVSLSLSPVTTNQETLYYGVLRDVDADETEHIERESNFAQLITHMNSVEDEELIAKGRYDLIDNRILYYQREAEESLYLEERVTFDIALEKMVVTAISKEQGQQLKEKLNREKLIQDFADGNTEGTFEYKRRVANHTSIWSLLKYSIYEEPNTGHPIFFVYTYNNTEHVLENRMIGKLGTTEYDVLGLIDVESHQFESKSVKGVKSLASAGNIYIKGRFEDVVHGQILATVAKTEQEDLERQLSLEAIMSALEENETYYVAFSAVRANHMYRRKKMNFCYLDETKTTIFYYCSDITEPYNREQEQLHKTEDALEAARAASSAKTEFFSRMSHDMRTPMNGILGLADLSEEETDLTILKENIRKIKNSGQYLLGLINDTLDWQKIESGKLKIEPEIVAVNDVLEDVCNMIQSTAKIKGVTFRVLNINAKLDYYIRADAMRLKQIFVNLLSNAVKFTPSGGTVELKIEPMSGEGNLEYDRITVTDTGIGMSKAFLENGIFQPFSQENNGVTASYAGTGLGLSIVKKLVELMGGQIQVESEKNAGTTFTVFLTFERISQRKVADEKREEKNQKKQMIQNLKGRKILLAEDHPLNAEIAKRLLEKVGCEVIWTKDGEECVKTFESEAERSYDAILMDIRMPRMDGIEATKVIRTLQHEDATEIPIVAMTANAYEEDVKKCLESGMNAHVSKPIDPPVLYMTLAESFIR